MGIPPPGPGMSIVFRQSPHDLDRLRVFREHHLAFGAVHVVTYVRLLPSGRSRACAVRALGRNRAYFLDRKSTRLNSSHVAISYAVFCLKKKKQHISPLPVL